MVVVGIGGRFGGCLEGSRGVSRGLEAVSALVLLFHCGVLSDLGLIWIGFPFEMMMGRGGGRGFLLYGIRTPVRCGDAASGALKMSQVPAKLQGGSTGFNTGKISIIFSV